MREGRLLDRRTFLPPSTCERIDEDLLYLDLRPDEQEVALLWSDDPDGLIELLWARVVAEEEGRRFRGLLLGGSRISADLAAGELIEFGRDEVVCVRGRDPFAAERGRSGAGSHGRPAMDRIGKALGLQE